MLMKSLHTAYISHHFPIDRLSGNPETVQLAVLLESLYFSPFFLLSRRVQALIILALVHDSAHEVAVDVQDQMVMERRSSTV